MNQLQNVLRELPSGAEDRKACPITTGVLDYFPLAIAEIARISKAGNDQHNPGQPLHWAREKSTDQADCIVRHLIQRGTIDTDGARHSGKMAWRALALLQEELEAEAGFIPIKEVSNGNQVETKEVPQAQKYKWTTHEGSYIGITEAPRAPAPPTPPVPQV